MPLYKYTLPNWIQDYINTMLGEYGSKDYIGKMEDNKVQITELRDFDPSENPVAQESTRHNAIAESSTTGNTNAQLVDELPF